MKPGLGIAFLVIILMFCAPAVTPVPTGTPVPPPATPAPPTPTYTPVPENPARIKRNRPAQAGRRTECGAHCRAGRVHAQHGAGGEIL
jgi:hypothetical protein